MSETGKVRPRTRQPGMAFLGRPSSTLGCRVIEEGKKVAISKLCSTGLWDSTGHSKGFYEKKIRNVYAKWILILYGVCRT
ncbi:hypothetical protein TNCV_2340601 [Trichonephila clavipes]|nr:hypothetical protein TNCV_2340601 [Trichonephila clavipes]